MEDKRQIAINNINAARSQQGKTLLIPRQEHLVREFVDDDGAISNENATLLYQLLESNSL